MSREPLGLPRGSVRAILTLLLVVVSAVMIFVQPASKDVGAMFVMLTAIAVRDYFQQRKVQNDEDGPALPPPSDGSGEG